MIPLRTWLSVVVVALAGGCAHLPPPNTARPFAFPLNAFAFANETVFTYGKRMQVPSKEAAATTEDHFTRRCFVMSRAAVQFWKTARFEPNAPPVDDAELEIGRAHV